MSKVIYGNRIKLRQMSQSDAKDIFSNIQDQDIAFNTPLKVPYSMQDSKNYIKRCNSNPNHHELGIQHYDSCEIIGVISVYNIHQKTPMIGYWISKQYRNLGYANESLNLFIRYCIKDLKLSNLTANILSSNIASIRLIEKYNFNLQGQSTIDDKTSNKKLILNHYLLTEAIAST